MNIVDEIQGRIDDLERENLRVLLKNLRVLLKNFEEGLALPMAEIMRRNNIAPAELLDGDAKKR